MMSTENCSLNSSFSCDNVSNSTTLRVMSLPNLTQGLMLQIALLLVVLGNLLVLFALKIYKRWTAPDVLICSLSIADLLDSLVGLQILTIMKYFLAAPWMRWLCEAYLTLLYTFRLASATTVSLMSAERAVLVVRPIKHHTMVTALFVRNIVLAVWLFSLVLSVLPLLGVGHSGYRIDGQKCLVQIYDFGFSYAILIEVYGLLLILFTLACYIAIKLTTKKFIIRQASLGLKQPYKRQEGKSSHERFPERKGKRIERTVTGGIWAVKRLNVMMAIVVFVYYISWCPFLLNNLVSIIINKEPNQKVSAFAGLISLLHALVNPVLYGKMSQRYRRGYVHMLRTILAVCGGERPVDPNVKDSISAVAPARGAKTDVRMNQGSDNPVFCNPIDCQTIKPMSNDNTDQQDKRGVDDITKDVVKQERNNPREKRAYTF